MPKLTSQNGTFVVTLSVATKESWKVADGSWQSRTDWHRIVTFGKQAEFTRTLTKGSYVMVQGGAVRTREYEQTVCNSAFSKCVPTQLANSITQSAALKPKLNLTQPMPAVIGLSPMVHHQSPF